MIIQRENGKSSAFSFTMMPNPSLGKTRDPILAGLKEADIGYRIVTGGCITRHDVIKHYDYATLGDLPNANYVHDQGFFVGNHPFDLTEQIEKLRSVVDAALRH